MDIGVLIQNFVEQYGLLSVFMIVFLEYCNMPIPSEVVLPMVGIMVSQGSIGVGESIVVSLIAGIIGSLLNYCLGYYLGSPLIKKIVSVSPKLQKSVDSSMWWISRYGEVSVMISRVIPLVRTFISIPAGVIKMRLSKFMIYSSIGIAIWNTGLIYMGYVCGNNIVLIAELLRRYSIGMIGILGLIMVILYALVKKSKK